MDTKTAATPSLQAFEKFEVGVIHFDAARKVLAMNDYARRVLPMDETQPFDKWATFLSPDRSQSGIDFLLEKASGFPAADTLPMTMIINIPEQVLLVKVSRLGDEKDMTTGSVLLFYDVTQAVGHVPSSSHPVKAGSSMRLSRIPTVANQKVSFVNTHDVLCLESQAHYTRVLTREGYHFCNLSIGDLTLRLDPAQFMRVHRCFIVNLEAVHELGRSGTKTHLLLKGKNLQAVPVSRSEVGRLREALGLN